jgi:hypothetical protein
MQLILLDPMKGNSINSIPLSHSGSEQVENKPTVSMEVRISLSQ